MTRAFLVGRSNALARLPVVAIALVTAALLAAPRDVRADEPSALATWGVRANPADATSAGRRDAPSTRAREMLARARFLDEAAAIDEKAAAELAARLPAMRLEAKAARDRESRAATAEQREILAARAEDLEADITISEAEIPYKKKTASENRRVAHDLRVRAVRLVREEPAADASAPLYDPTAPACDPPFRYTPDGRKVYRIECLKP